MSKVTVVGAGNVGATCANVLAFNEVADEVVMLDIKEGVSEGKAMDMMQTAQSAPRRTPPLWVAQTIMQKRQTPMLWLSLRDCRANRV